MLGCVVKRCVVGECVVNFGVVTGGCVVNGDVVSVTCCVCDGVGCDLTVMISG